MPLLDADDSVHLGVTHERRDPHRLDIFRHDLFGEDAGIPGQDTSGLWFPSTAPLAIRKARPALVGSSEPCVAMISKRAMGNLLFDGLFYVISLMNLHLRRHA